MQPIVKKILGAGRWLIDKVLAVLAPGRWGQESLGFVAIQSNLLGGLQADETLLKKRWTAFLRMTPGLLFAPVCIHMNPTDMNMCTHT